MPEEMVEVAKDVPRLHPERGRGEGPGRPGQPGRGELANLFKGRRKALRHVVAAEVRFGVVDGVHEERDERRVRVLGRPFEQGPAGLEGLLQA